jgi:hypothetical protein
MLTLPTYSECVDAVREGKETPLHVFIHLNEPAVSDEMFREELQAAINYAFEQGASK